MADWRKCPLHFRFSAEGSNIPPLNAIGLICHLSGNVIACAVKKDTALDCLHRHTHTRQIARICRNKSRQMRACTMPHQDDPVRIKTKSAGLPAQRRNRARNITRLITWFHIGNKTVVE